MVRLRMSNPARNEMDVDAFLAWAEGREGRWELRDGKPVMMSPERAAHALIKLSAQIALREGVRRAGLPCRVFPDGMTVRVAAGTAFDPDALVVCPPPPISARSRSQTRSSSSRSCRRARLRTITESNLTAIFRLAAS